MDVAEKPWRRYETTVEAWNGDDNNPGRTWEITEGDVKVRVRIKPKGEVIFSVQPGSWVVYDSYLRAKSEKDWCAVYVRRDR